MKRFFYRLVEGRTVNVYVDAVDKKAADEKLEHQEYTVCPEDRNIKIKGFPGAELIKEVGYTLKPCPFCGGQATITEWEDDWSDRPSRCFKVGCQDTNCIGNIDLEFDTAVEAAKAWNKRVKEE